MIPTEKAYKLMEFYNRLAKEKGIDLEWIGTGGGNHSRREHLIVDSIEERIGLMVSLIDEMYVKGMFKKR